MLCTVNEYNVVFLMLFTKTKMFKPKPNLLSTLVGKNNQQHFNVNVQIKKIIQQ